MPGGKDILIKSIQLHDEPVQESKSPARVGLAIKGVSHDEISRGDIICSPDDTIMNVALPGKHISATFRKNSYYRSDILENQAYMICRAASKANKNSNRS